MALYNVVLTSDSSTFPFGKVDLLKVSFGDPSSNDKIVAEVAATMKNMALGGAMCLINGPASLPVALVLGHAVAHLYSCVGVFDPKLQGYVIAISHGGPYSVGEIVKY